MEESPTEACAQETSRVLRESSFCFIAVTLQFLQDGCSLDWFASFDFFFMFSIVSKFWKLICITPIALAVEAHFYSVYRPTGSWDGDFIYVNLFGPLNQKGTEQMF